MKATTNRTTLAKRRYLLEFSVAMVIYMVVLVGTRFWLDGYHGAWRVAVEVAPALPIVGIVVAGIRLYRATDEFARTIMTNSLAIAGIVTGLSAVTYAFMEGDSVPRPSAWWVYTLFMATWLCAALVMKWRYR